MKKFLRRVHAGSIKVAYSLLALFMVGVIILAPFHIMMKLAGGPDDQSSFGMALYLMWPLFLLLLSGVWVADVIVRLHFRKIWNKKPGIGTISVLSFYFLPILMNLASTLASWIGQDRLAAALFSYRWTSQTVVIGVCIAAGILLGVISWIRDFFWLRKPTSTLL